MSVAPTQLPQMTLVTGPLARKSSRYRHLPRWIVLLLIGCGVALVYLYSTCWAPSSHHAFNAIHRLQSAHRANQGSGCLFGKRGTPTSLLVRPLKHVANSPAIQTLTEASVESLFKNVNTSQSTDHHCVSRPFWLAHHGETGTSRRSRLERICADYQFDGRIFRYRHRASNRKQPITNDSDSNIAFCSTRNCPLLVDETNSLLTCFVQKVASTSIKQLFVHLSQNGDSQGNNNNSSGLPPEVANITTFHIAANSQIKRISPISVRNSKESSYFKTIFVRHPFVRLVSAFKDKAERGPDQEAYFYTRYWYPLLEHIHGENNYNSSSRVEFREFVEEFILPNDPYQYDEHWAPIWTRCEPCFIHYDLIGKLETSESDFQNLTAHINRTLSQYTFWANPNHQFGTEVLHSSEENERKCEQLRFKYRETVRYLSQLRPQTIIELYKRYYLDFELFGYTLEELFQT